MAVDDDVVARSVVLAVEDLLGQLVKVDGGEYVAGLCVDDGSDHGVLSLEVFVGCVGLLDVENLM